MPLKVAIIRPLNTPVVRNTIILVSELRNNKCLRRAGGKTENKSMEHIILVDTPLDTPRLNRITYHITDEDLDMRINGMTLKQCERMIMNLLQLKGVVKTTRYHDPINCWNVFTFYFTEERNENNASDD